MANIDEIYNNGSYKVKQTIDKKTFANKLMDIMDYVEKNCNEGQYLHLSNEMKILFDMIKELTTDESSRRYIQHLRRVAQRPIVIRRKLKHQKYPICDRCGRQVLDIRAHQERDICEAIKNEKELTLLLKKINVSYITATQASITIQSLFKGFMVRKQMKQQKEKKENKVKKILKIKK